jgi:hypothetical protein
VTNSFLAQLHAERLARRPPPAAEQQVPAPRQQEQRQQEQRQPSAASNSQPEQELRLLTYNLWFAEDVEVAARMVAVSAIVEQEGRLPHFLCLQASAVGRGLGQSRSLQLASQHKWAIIHIRQQSDRREPTAAASSAARPGVPSPRCAL